VQWLEFLILASSYQARAMTQKSDITFVLCLARATADREIERAENLPHALKK
jgi:hypothetical protein